MHIYDGSRGRLKVFDETAWKGSSSLEELAIDCEGLGDDHGYCEDHGYLLEGLPSTLMQLELRDFNILDGLGVVMDASLPRGLTTLCLFMQETSFSTDDLVCCCQFFTSHV